MLRALSLLLVCVAATAAAAEDVTLAEVNDHRLTSRDLDAFLAIRGLPETISASLRERIVEEMIDRELVRQFLERRRTEADPAQLAAAVRAGKKQLARGAEDIDAAIAKLGVDEDRLKSELALSLAWRRHVARVLTDNRIREHFELNRKRLDGSRLRISQIFMKYADGESPKAAPKSTARLESLRNEIVAGKISFSEAAKIHSQAPSAAEGGDLGWISPRGDVPAAVAEAAYLLLPSEVSPVVLSPLGVHLVVVTEVKPGDLSLEDARPAIFEELSKTLWDETVASERRSAKIIKNKQPR